MIIIGATQDHQSNSECRKELMRSKTVGAKLHGREGNSPDRRLRPQNLRSVQQRRYRFRDTEEVGLEAATL